ncbi:hypothetical protein BRADI_2g47965v3 [Brachypodium distachyon]|uniref:Uncharacterized protein n=1 Tax=Brachypodium distachyon TaxID=15368 RepID=A0A0Q3R877_BRADI|nr:hypothetical protein BRADI_2g47965v3 [Brachypodium distachyon]
MRAAPAEQAPRRPAQATRRSPPSSAPQPYYKTAPLPPSSKAQSRPIPSGIGAAGPQACPTRGGTREWRR